MLDVYFGICTADPLVLNKASYLTMQESPIRCSVYDACSILSPALKLRYNAALMGYNYFYIPDWGRYYFMETPELQPGEIMMIRGSEDYLYSHMAEINALECNIIRQENLNTAADGKFIQDNEITKSGKSYVKTLKFTGDGANFFNYNVEQKHCYLLTIVGGVDNTSQGRTVTEDEDR